MKNFWKIALTILFVIPAAFVSAQEIDPLMQAYQREFIYLDNEIRLLEKRITEVEADGGSRVDEARDELNRLENRLLSLQDEVERQVQALTFIEDEESSSYDAYDTVSTIITQANSRLDKYDIPHFKQVQGEGFDKIPENELAGRELDYVFSESIEILGGMGDVRTEEGQFFLSDGKTVDGKLVHIGQIAAFGTSAEHSGTLAPAGGGMFHLIKEENADAANTLAEGGMPSTLPIFIYESADKLVEAAAGKTLKDTIDGGGIIGLVIIGLGIIGFILVVIRAVTLSRVNPGKQDETVENMVENIENGDLNAALALCKNIQGAMNRVLTSTVTGLIESPKKVEDAIAESVLNEQPPLNRFRSAITVFAAVSPLLGLLGTVTGMISTFEVITVYGTGDPKLLSGGISAALVTTEFGLIVAIPLVLIGNLLSNWANSINANLEISALRMVNASSGFKRSRKIAKKGKKN